MACERVTAKYRRVAAKKLSLTPEFLPYKIMVIVFKPLWPRLCWFMPTQNTILL